MYADHYNILCETSGGASKNICWGQILIINKLLLNN